MMRIGKSSHLRLALPGVLLVGLFASSPAHAVTAPEEPLTEPAEVITGTTATLHGELNPSASATAGYEFTYGPNGTCEGLTTTPGGEATGKEIAVATPVTGLEGNSEYTFCVVALHTENEETAATTGLPLKFKTPAAAPEIIAHSESDSSLTPFDAVLEGQVNTEKQTTSYHFEYALNPGLASATSIGGGSLSGTTEAQATGPVDIGGSLSSATIYYYRVVATNATGTTDGEIEEFATPAAEAPTIIGESASEVARTSAHLHAVINPNYQNTTYQFKIGTDTTYSLATLPGTAGELGGGFGGVEAVVNLQTPEEVELQPNTEYHYEALATNATGTTEGLTALGIGDQTFLTLPSPPTVSTGSATHITPVSAVVSASVNPNAAGHASQDDTSYYFQYGHNSNYGGRTPLPSGEAGEGNSPVAEAATLEGLEPGTTYHYRIVASNDNSNTEDREPQSVYGNDKTFPTPSTPPVLSAVQVASITQSTATITATLEPQGLPTRYELQLGSTPGFLATNAVGNTTQPSSLSLAVGSLTAGTVYYYKLIASNLNGTVFAEGSFTSEVIPAGSPTPVAQPPTPPLLATPAIAFPAEPIPILGGKLTNAQKLAKALKLCKRDKKRVKRVACQRRAHQQYPTKRASTPKNGH